MCKQFQDSEMGKGEKKSTPKPRPEQENIPPPLTEEQVANIQSVQFQPAVVKKIISCHSGSILADPEPYIELVDTIERKARDIFNKFEEESGQSTGKISKSHLNAMLTEIGYTIQHDLRSQVIEKYCPDSDEIDERKWLEFLEKYQAPSYYYGQRLRQYCGRGQISDVIQLLCRGCDVNTGDGEGLTSLHYASEANYPDVIQTLYDLTGSHLAINAQDKYGWTPLHSACHHGNIDCVKLLIKLGADVTVTEKVGKTPLHLAVAQVSSLLVNLNFSSLSLVR